MRANCSPAALLLLTAVAQSTSSELSFSRSSANITSRLVNMFQMNIQWKSQAANCTPAYEITISVNSGKLIGGLPIYFPYIVEIGRFSRLLGLNNYFSTEIKARCNGTIIEQANRSHMHWMARGDEKTSVKNFICVWYYMEYISCTWQPTDNPPIGQYRLHYWEQDENSRPAPPASAQLQDLLRTGNECQDNFPSDGLYLGCKFPYYKESAGSKYLLFVVTDTSYTVRPSLLYARAREIAKPKSPTIMYVSEVINGILYVNWTMSPPLKNLNFEVHVSSDKWPIELNRTTENYSMNISIPHTDGTLKVKVRASFTKYVNDISNWSDWSEERIVPGQTKNTTSILPLILIPAAVIVLVILLLVYLKRLKILLLPPIPHPGKKFQSDLQHWLKNERPADFYIKPEKEEISPVSLIEA
ncbi:hypothetical protein GDO78_013394 [Eleutherodactylus coqui]|uniref:Type I cytokine receptor cytokine-binding domain-containing protein n=1 Tax=Eleutherodactylus coqui TaxID=57060 RepID=A0A8J6F199_ELECQ|nr:hypothetical protein GDO78_013394 [Eleutherodactylus coqui]